MLLSDEHNMRHVDLVAASAIDESAISANDFCWMLVHGLRWAACQARGKKQKCVPEIYNR